MFWFSIFSPSLYWSKPSKQKNVANNNDIIVAIMRKKDARSWDILASIVLLLPLFIITDLSLRKVDARDIIPSTLLLINGIAAFVDSLFYKVEAKQKT